VEEESKRMEEKKKCENRRESKRAERLEEGRGKRKRK
jgi:hypothetical protein